MSSALLQRMSLKEWTMELIPSLNLALFFPNGSYEASPWRCFIRNSLWSWNIYLLHMNRYYMIYAQLNWMLFFFFLFDMFKWRSRAELRLIFWMFYQTNSISYLYYCKIYQRNLWMCHRFESVELSMLFSWMKLKVMTMISLWVSERNYLLVCFARFNHRWSN